MTTQTRKQREIAERQELILDEVERLLLDLGYRGLTMDKVAAATEYSKGTLYQHFKSKEDAIAALLVRYTQRRAEMFSRATTFVGNSRERIGAVGAAAEVYALLYPAAEQLEKVVKLESLRDKADPARTELVSSCETMCFEVALGVVNHAIASGDLTLPPGFVPEQVVLGLWSLYAGGFLLRELGVLEGVAPGLADLTPSLLGNAAVYLDGLGWKPLSADHDPFAARLRALEELFPSEARRAGLLP